MTVSARRVMLRWLKRLLGVGVCAMAAVYAVCLGFALGGLLGVLGIIVGVAVAPFVVAVMGTVFGSEHARSAWVEGIWPTLGAGLGAAAMATQMSPWVNEWLIIGAALLASVYGAGVLGSGWTKRKRRRAAASLGRVCARCGYSLAGLSREGLGAAGASGVSGISGGVVCPECGLRVGLQSARHADTPAAR